MSDKILTSTEYGLFDLHQYNRDINFKRLSEIMASMKELGFLSEHAIAVKKLPNNRLEIRSGHHRFQAARNLVIPVKYILSDPLPPGKMEPCPWTSHDFLAAGCRAGNPSYLQVRNYINKTGIGLSNAVSMFSGYSAGSGGVIKSFRLFEFQAVEDTSHAEKVGNIVICLTKIGISWANSHNFVMAVSKVAWLNEFDPTKFIEKVKKNKSRMENQHSVVKHIEMIEAIYNIHERSKINLKIMADASAHKRMGGS